MLEKNAAYPPPSISFSTDLEESQNSALAMIGGPLATLLTSVKLTTLNKKSEWSSLARVFNLFLSFVWSLKNCPLLLPYSLLFKSYPFLQDIVDWFLTIRAAKLKALNLDESEPNVSVSFLLLFNFKINSFRFSGCIVFLFPE